MVTELLGDGKSVINAATQRIDAHGDRLALHALEFPTHILFGVHPAANVTIESKIVLHVGRI